MFITVVEIIGTVAFTVSGAMVAIDKKVDIFGVAFLSLTTAVGGGIVRDILMGNIPPKIFNTPFFILLSLFTSLLIFLIAFFFKEYYLKKANIVDRINNVFDALGLGIFSVIGTKIAFDNGLENSIILMLVLGLMTAVGGGIVRDILIREIPFVLKKRIYAVASLFGSGAYILLRSLSLSDSICVVLGTATVFILRVLATVFEWDLPKAID